MLKARMKKVLDPDLSNLNAAIPLSAPLLVGRCRRSRGSDKRYLSKPSETSGWRASTN